MSKPVILCVDDQREVLAALSKDLESYTADYEIVLAETADEADELLQQFQDENQRIALMICDHIMPGENGVDFMARITTDEKYVDVKKILLTGLATQQDTIRAINQARIDAFLEKPWDPNELTDAVNRVL